MNLLEAEKAMEFGESNAKDLIAPVHHRPHGLNEEHSQLSFDIMDLDLNPDLA